MSQYRVAVLIGSLRKESLNRKLADAIYLLASENISFHESLIADLPLYNQDDDGNQAASVKRLKSEILRADAVLFVTPEYNRSVPGVLKNAIDHASRPRTESAWLGKPAAMAGISPSPTGSSMSQQHLRNILAALDAPTLCLPEIFFQAREGFMDESGKVGKEGNEILVKWMTSFAAWIAKHAEQKHGNA